MNHPVNCPYCSLVFESLLSYSDSRASLRYHIVYKHPGENEDASDDVVGDSTNDNSSGVMSDCG